MRIKQFHILLIVLFALVCYTCREKYTPNVPVIPTGYLVAEGYINSGTGPTVITLSHTTGLNSGAIVYETKALVRVEGKQNTTPFVLTEIRTGVYSYPQLTLNPNDQYRVYIKTAKGKEYVSDYSDVRRTEDIDSLSWQRNSTGVQVLVNAHDNSSSVGYYRFTFNETWEIHSKYVSYLKVFYDRFGTPDHAGYRDSTTYQMDSSIFRCWQADTPRNILVYSSEKLKGNIVAFPFVNIEPQSVLLSVRYSAQVQMYQISKPCMLFYDQMRKNTELLGSIFDAQPSGNNGNMHAVADSNEVVVGFIEVTEQKQGRIFISADQVPNWGYDPGCPDQEGTKNTYNPRRSNTLADHVDWIPTVVINVDPIIGVDSFYRGAPICVDCTLRGTNKKPPFW